MNKLFLLVNRTQRSSFFNMKKYCSHAVNFEEKLKKMELSTTYRQTKKNEYSLSSRYLLTTPEDRDEFLTVYPKMVDYILAIPEIKEFDQFHTRIADMLDYLIHSRLNRGTLTCVAYKEMKTKYPATVYAEEDYDICKMTGWAMEMAEAFIIITDDLLDLSDERRSMPCWYRFKNHGLLSTYDSFYIKLLAYQILKKYCAKHPAYVRITSLLHHVNHELVIGQIAALNPDMSIYNANLYKKIVHHKTEFFMYYEPVMLGVLSAYVDDEELIKEISDLTLDMGFMYQKQNDVSDAYGPYQATGKISNDIQQGTCTWIISTALGLANAGQKKVLHDNYGKKDTDAEKRILDVYAQLDILEIYRRQKQTHYKEFKKRIDTGSSLLPHETLMCCLKHASTYAFDNVKIDTVFEYV